MGIKKVVPDKNVFKALHKASTYYKILDSVFGNVDNAISNIIKTADRRGCVHVHLKLRRKQRLCYGGSAVIMIKGD